MHDLIRSLDRLRPFALLFLRVGLGAIFLLHGLGIDTGIDLDALVDTAAFISGVLGRKPVSRVANAVLAKRGVPA